MQSNFNANGIQRRISPIPTPQQLRFRLEKELSVLSVVQEIPFRELQWNRLFPGLIILRKAVVTVFSFIHAYKEFFYINCSLNRQFLIAPEHKVGDPGIFAVCLFTAQPAVSVYVLLENRQVHSFQCLDPILRWDKSSPELINKNDVIKISKIKLNFIKEPNNTMFQPSNKQKQFGNGRFCSNAVAQTRPISYNAQLLIKYSRKNCIMNT